MRATHKIRRGIAVVAAVAAVASLAACSGGDNSGTKSGSTGGDGAKPVTYGMIAEQGPSWIAPISPPDKMVTANSAIHLLMWQGLFNYNGADGTMQLDKKASVASDYKFNDDNTSVEITLGDLAWSDDGSQVTSRDVEFNYNIIKALGEDWGSYSAGNYPENVTEFKIIDDKHFSMTFDKTYNQEYLLGNQLTLITPMPQHAWDKTSADGEIGDYDQTPEGAMDVYNFIQDQAKDMSTYSTNPLWQVVNGPYVVKTWTPDGSITLVANEKYTGADKPSISTVNFKPYTSEDAEMNDLRAKGLDYGFVTAAQLENEKQFTDLGYTINPWAGWSITYMPYNFANPTMGPVFKQLYVRQGLQSAIDQEAISEKIWKGAAMPGYGPVPQNPTSDYLSPDQTNNPYPFDLDAAAKFFTDNGWTKGADGILACTNAGTGAGQCGEGVAAGTQMKIVFTSQNGSQETTNMMAAIKESMSEIGVDVTINEIPLDSVLTEAQTCKSGSSCDWQFVFFGTAGSWYFSAYPTGDRLFAADVKWNCGQYEDPEAFKIISETLTSSDPKAAQAYSSYLAKNLPVLWMPNPVYQISAINSDLDVATQDPLGSFMPQRWSWK
jgi:peptide/nickel transport system substrate-binding protein